MPEYGGSGVSVAVATNVHLLGNNNGVFDSRHSLHLLSEARRGGDHRRVADDAGQIDHMVGRLHTNSRSKLRMLAKDGLDLCRRLLVAWTTLEPTLLVRGASADCFQQ